MQRIGGSNLFGSYVNDALVLQLAEGLDFWMMQYNQPMAVFINDAYYGFAYLQNRRSADDLAEYLGVAKEDIQQVEVNFDDWNNHSGSDTQSVEDFNAVWGYLDADFNDDAVFEAFCDLVDLKSFLNLTAIDVYTGDYDSFIVNNRAVRYSRPQEEETTPYLDWILGKEPDPQERDAGNRLLVQLLQCPEVREDFVNILCDFGQYTFSNGDVSTVLGNVIAEAGAGIAQTQA